jgi:hypothetical protein
MSIATDLPSSLAALRSALPIFQATSASKRSN